MEQKDKTKTTVEEEPRLDQRWATIDEEDALGCGGGETTCDESTTDNVMVRGGEEGETTCDEDVEDKENEGENERTTDDDEL